MRFGFSIRILRGLRGGVRAGRGRKPSLWASERLGPIRITQTTTPRSKRRKTR